MKSGLTIVEMAQQIERQSKLKQDYLLDTRRLQVEPFGSQLYLHTFDDHDDPLVEPLEINQIAHRQIGTHLKIPAAYYDRMLSDYPELLAENVNSWFQREPTQRMVRTLDGTVRAFLSNRYRRIDNLDIAEIVLPVIQQMEDAYFESCQITDSRMYIKVVNKRLEAEVVPGDIVQSGVIISNSEVGLGSVNIQPLVYRLVCSNGMVVNDAQTRRTHIGRVNEADENFQLFSQETLAADDHAFAMKIKDTVMAAVDETRFTRVVGMMREATTVQMNTTDIPSVVRLASKDFNITEEESTGVLQRLIEGKDLTLYGLSNAVTRFSQDVDSYDRATALEGIGYNILYLLRSGEYMPLQINLPPTSIKPFKDFLNRAFMFRCRATCGSIVQIGLKRENNGTNDYSVATFKLLQDFQGEELAQIRAYANSFKEQIKLLLQQRTEITEEQRDTGCDYVIEPGAMTNEPADGHYTVSQINGDCEQLPA